MRFGVSARHLARPLILVLACSSFAWSAQWRSERIRPGAIESLTAPVPSVALSASTSAIDRGSSTLTAGQTIVRVGGSATLTWSGTGVDSCTAGGGWSGSRPRSGRETVGPINRATTFSLTCSGPGGRVVEMLSISTLGNTTISWQAPTENTDGTRLTDLAGYLLYYGQTSGRYTDVVELTDPATTSYVLSLPSGSYFLAMTAIDQDGNESARSNEIMRQVP